MTRRDTSRLGGMPKQKLSNPIQPNPTETQLHLQQVAQNLKVPPSRAAASKRAALMVQLAKEMSMGVDPILQVCGVWCVCGGVG